MSGTWSTRMLLVVFQSLHLCRVDSSDWSYDGKQGVGSWSKLSVGPSANECASYSQSPIHIKVRSTICADSLGPMRYLNYDEPLCSPDIVNNGHTVQVSALHDRFHGIRLPHPASTFRFLQFHFHWGNSSARGSEHVVDDNSYSMEMHLVHMNTKYTSVEQASKHGDGLAVVAVLFKVVREEDNRDFEVIVDAVGQVQTGENMHMNVTKPVVLSRLLPKNTVDHFQYFGSLTTPPCSEAVTWIVLRKAVAISERQLTVFRQVQASGPGHGSSHALMDNFRPPMPLHGRYVLRNFHCPQCQQRREKLRLISQREHQAHFIPPF
uniref:Carbonic anhydrase n=1 Tax=Ixodes ricinus TaxID=34613 RepID=A0A147BEV1_IXORI